MPDLRIVPNGEGPANPATKATAVAIYGFTDHKTQGPLGVPGWENWGLNELYRYMPLDKFSRWFELHPRADFEKPAEQGGDPEHIKSLMTFGIPVYMTVHHDDIPASVALPRAFIEAGIRDKYITSTPAWMLALAIAEGFTTIGLFGIDMAQDIEYADQRPCMEYLIGLARGRGITVILPKTSDMCKAVAQYGFESEGSELMLKMRERQAWLNRERVNQEGKLANLEKDYAEKSAQLTHQYQDFRAGLLGNLAQIKGALDDIAYWMRSWGTRPISPEAGQNVTPSRVGPWSGITKTWQPGDPLPGSVPVAQSGDNGSVSVPVAPSREVVLPVGRQAALEAFHGPGAS